MSKAQRIRDMLDAGKRTGEIAAEVGVSVSYVCIVRKRRTCPANMRPSDVAWIEANAERRKAYRRTTHQRAKQRIAQEQSSA